MSAGALAATLAVAFVGGAGGAILGPWITHRFGRTERLAGRRREPYERITAAAQDFVELSRRIGPDATEEQADEFYARLNALANTTHTPEAELVRSREVALLVDALLNASQKVVITPGPPPDTPHDQLVPALQPRLAALTELSSAYERLREQLARETGL